MAFTTESQCLGFLAAPSRRRRGGRRARARQLAAAAAAAKEMEVWKMIFLFNWAIVRFHVNFQGCI